MAEQRMHTVGLLPVGALSVALYHHLTHGGRSADGICFLARAGSSGAGRVAEGGGIHVEAEGQVQTLPATLQRGDLLAAAKAGELPEIIIVCTNPDQIHGVLNNYLQVLQWEYEQGRTLAGAARLPALVLSSNGIYFQRVRRTLIELAEESTLLGRLPDLWPEAMPLLVGRLLRGVTMQTGMRRGSGAGAVYRPGPRGRTLIAGGSSGLRAEVTRALAARGGWYEDAGPITPTQAEFNKGLVNLSSNLLGLLIAIDLRGEFRPLTVGEVTAAPHQPRIRELVHAVVKVGQALKVYSSNHDTERAFEEVMKLNCAASSHVPSSLQWVEAQLATGTALPEITPTEEWLLRPLQHYARSSGDERLITYFETLETQLIAALARAAAHQKSRAS